MKFLRQLVLTAAAVTLFTTPARLRADVDTNATPSFEEVYHLLRQHMVGENDADLNRHAVRGLIDQLHSKVSLVNGKASAAAPANSNLLIKTTLINEKVAYLQVAHVEAGLAGQIAAAYKQFDGTNRLAGVVLDLRFADGQDYSEAAAVADLFISKERPLMDWGNGLVESKAKTDAFALPLAILVNQQTSQAAEAVAAVLRQDDRAIILGSTTAGLAAMSQDFPLDNGQILRIATADIKLGGGETLSAKGVRPDIQVAVSPENEKIYYTNPYAEIVSTQSVISTFVTGANGETAVATNRTNHTRLFNEAELMRERNAKPGVDVEDLVPSDLPQAADAEKPIIRDPVLGRALDLITGISVMRQSQAP